MSTSTYVFMEKLEKNFFFCLFEKEKKTYLEIGIVSEDLATSLNQ